MKQIVEEWKVIEGLRKYEISSFGRCRNIKTGRLIKPLICTKTSANRYYHYMMYSSDTIVRKNIGKLVATYFVPNPNGYKNTNFKDGNTENFMYTNIEWVKYPNLSAKYYLRKYSHRNITPDGVLPKRKKRTKEELLASIDRGMNDLKIQREHVESDRIGEYVFNHAAGVLKALCLRIKGTSRRGDGFVNAYIAFASNLMIEALADGYPIISIAAFFNTAYHKFVADLNRQKKTASQYNEELLRDNPQDLDAE
jgi:hypothetical protein